MPFVKKLLKIHKTMVKIERKKPIGIAISNSILDIIELFSMFLKTQKQSIDDLSIYSGANSPKINFNNDLEVFNELLFASSKSAGNSRDYSPRRLELDQKVSVILPIEPITNDFYQKMDNRATASKQNTRKVIKSPIRVLSHTYRSKNIPKRRPK